MSKNVIRVENLGKKYQLHHQQQGGRYKTIREVISSKVGGLLGGSKAVTEGPKSTEDFWALRDVSFEIQQGEAVGIIGRNGAGKSTLLKLLSRITQPTTGRMELEGRVASLLEVGTGFHPELTGRENIYLNGAILGMGRLEIKRKFDEIVDFAEVEKFLDTPVKRYSSGMYMRLAFAVAAHLEPEILVVDEVLAVGDAAFQKKCLGKMGEVSSGGRTVLFVSHQMNAVEQLCSRILQMENGRLKTDSTDLRGVIRDYLFGNEDAEIAARSHWARKDGRFDNPWFAPHRFYLGDQDGNALAMPVSNDSEMWVHIEADAASTDPALTIGYAIYSEGGEPLYWSYQTDTHPDEWPSIKRGPIKLRSQIPARLLNEGIYRIELIGGLHHREWLFEPGRNAPQIFLNIQGGLSDSPLWTMKRPGLMAPVIPWSLLS
jgi:lipopolysaccharide transport system ATP-binding protein